MTALKYECEYCDKKFTSIKAWEKHLHKKHVLELMGLGRKG